MTTPTTAEPKRFHSFRKGDPFRIEWRAKQLELVRAYRRLAEKHPVDDLCSCVAWVTEMAEMIEKLHEHIDAVDPDSVQQRR